MWPQSRGVGGYGGGASAGPAGVSQPLQSQRPQPGCELCNAHSFVSPPAAEAHFSSYRHCEAYLLKELSLGFSRFTQLYGGIQFGLTLEEGADLPENQFDPYDRLDLHLYRTFLVKKGYCSLCDSSIGSGLQGWRIHVKGQQHAQNYVKTLEQVGSVSAYRQKFGCLTDPPPSMIEVAKKALQQYKNDSYIASKQNSGQSGANSYPAYYSSDTTAFSYGSSSTNSPAKDSYSYQQQQPLSNNGNMAQPQSQPQYQGYQKSSGGAPGFSQEQDSYRGAGGGGGAYSSNPDFPRFDSNMSAQQQQQKLLAAFAFPGKTMMPEKEKSKGKEWLELERIRAEKEKLSRELEQQRVALEKQKVMMELEEHRRLKAEMDERRRRQEEQRQRERELEEQRQVQQQLEDEKKEVQKQKRLQEEMERERRQIVQQKRELEEAKRQTWLLDESRKLDIRLTGLANKHEGCRQHTALCTMMERLSRQRGHFERQCETVRTCGKERRRDEEARLDGLYSQLRILVEELRDESRDIEKQILTDKEREAESRPAIKKEIDEKGDRDTKTESKEAPEGDSKTEDKAGDIKQEAKEEGKQEDKGEEDTSKPPPSEKMLGVKVTGLNQRSSDQNIRNSLFHAYKSHGRIVGTVLQHQGAVRNAIITFKHEDDAAEALEASKTKLVMGMPVVCFPHPGIRSDKNRDLDEFHHKATRYLFVGNVDQEVTDAQIRQTFKEFGTILHIQYKEVAGPVFYMFIEYDNIPSVKMAIEKMEAQYMGGYKLKMGYAKAKETPTLWLGGVPEDINEVGLRASFETFGLISKVLIQPEKGRALVIFVDVEGARKASLALKGVVNPILGKKIMVDFASMRCQEAFQSELLEKTAKKGKEETEGEIVQEPKLPAEMCGVKLTNLPPRLADDSLKNALFHKYKSFGKLLHTSLSGQGPSRTAVITFKSASEANRAYDETMDKLILGTNLTAEKVDGIEISDKINEFHQRASRTLYIGNLDQEATKKMLEDEFSSYGKILSITISTTTKNLKYAFIEYDSIMPAVKAINEKDGITVGAEKITLYFGRTLSPGNVVQLENISEHTTMKYLTNIYTKHAVEVNDVQIDSQRARAMLYVGNVDDARKIVSRMKGMLILGKQTTNDYASVECQENFYQVQGMENPHPVKRPTEPHPQHAMDNNEEEEGMERFGAYEYEAGRGEWMDEEFPDDMGPQRDRFFSPGRRSRTPSWDRMPPEFRGGRSPEFRGRSPGFRGRSPGFRGRSPDFRGRSPGFRERSPGFRGGSPDFRGRSPGFRSRSPWQRPVSPRRRTPPPPRRSRSPRPPRRRSPGPRGKSPALIPRHIKKNKNVTNILSGIGPPAYLDRTCFQRDSTHIVFMGNFDMRTEKRQIVPFFADYGPILNIEMKDQRNQAFAFVELPSMEEAVNCVNANAHKKFDGKGIKFGFGKVTRARVVWLGNLPDEACEELLIEELDQFGMVLKAVVNKQKHSALVFFGTVHDAYCAYEGMFGGHILDKLVMVDYATGRMKKEFWRELVESGQMSAEDRDRFYEGEEKEAESKAEEGQDVNKYDEEQDGPEEIEDEFGFRASRTVYVGSLAKKISIRFLQDIFNEPGHLLNLSVKESGNSNFGFAEYSTIRAAATAIRTLHNTEIARRNIRVNFASPRVANVVHVEYLPEDITEQRLQEKFSEFGKILKVTLNERKCIALVVYADNESAEKAREAMHAKDLDGQRIIITYASPLSEGDFHATLGKGEETVEETEKTDRPKYRADSLKEGTVCRGMMVWNIPTRMSDKSLQECMHFHFKRFGKITNITITREGSLRYGVITFKNAEDAAEATAGSHRKRFLSQKIYVEKHEGITDDSYVPTEGKVDEFRYDSSRHAYVGNLPSKCTADDLRELFSPFGTILHISDVARMKFSYVEYSDVRSVVRAIEAMDGEGYEDKKLSVNFSRHMVPSDCLFVDHVAAAASEEDILQFSAQRPDVCNIVIDRDFSQALIFYNSIEVASKALPTMRKRGVLMGQNVAVDFASRLCQEHILDNMEKTKQITAVEKKDLLQYQITEGDNHLVVNEAEEKFTENQDMEYTDTGYFKYASKSILPGSIDTENVHATKLLSVNNVTMQDEPHLKDLLLPFGKILSMVFVPFRRCFVEFNRVKHVVAIIQKLSDTNVSFLNKPIKFGFGVRYVDPNAPREHRSQTILSKHFVSNQSKFQERFAHRYSGGRGSRGGRGRGFPRGRGGPRRESPPLHRQRFRDDDRYGGRRSLSPRRRSPGFRNDDWGRAEHYRSPPPYDEGWNERGFSPYRDDYWPNSPAREFHQRDNFRSRSRERFSPRRFRSVSRERFPPRGRSFSPERRMAPDFGGRRVEVYARNELSPMHRERSPNFYSNHHVPNKRKRSPSFSRDDRFASPGRKMRYHSRGRSPQRSRSRRRSPRRSRSRGRSPRRSRSRGRSPRRSRSRGRSPHSRGPPPHRGRGRSPHRGGHDRFSPARSPGRNKQHDHRHRDRADRLSPHGRNRPESSHKKKKDKNRGRSSSVDIWKRVNVPVGMTIKELRETVDTFGQILNKFLDVLFGREPIKRRVNVDSLPGAELAVAMELKHISGVSNYETIVNALDLLAVLPREVPYVLNMLSPEMVVDLAVARGHKVGDIGRTISKFMSGMLR